MQKSLILRQNWNREISKRLQKQSLAKRNLFSRTTLWVAVQHWSSEWPRGDNPTPTSGVVAVFCWTSLKKISHIHGQRQQVLEQLRGDTPHPWQRRSLSKMVGGANSCLKSNPIPTRDAKRAQTNLVHTRAQGPHRDWDRTVFECLLWRYRSAVDCHRDRGSGCSRLGYGISHLGRGHH